MNSTTVSTIPLMIPAVVGSWAIWPGSMLVATPALRKFLASISSPLGSFFIARAMESPRPLPWMARSCATLAFATCRCSCVRPREAPRTLWALWKPIAVVMVPMALVMLQPDLGTALAIVFGGAVVVFLAGVPGKWFAGAGVAALVIALTGCEAGEPDTGPGTDPPPESRAPIADPGDAPGPGLGIPMPEGTDRGSRQAAGTRAPHVHRTAQGTCDDLGAAQALRLSTTDPGATGILDKWDACLRTDTMPAYTWLRNRTGAVWILRTTPWDVVQEHRPGRTRLGTLQSGVMHRAAQERGKQSNASAFILPGESIWILTRKSATFSAARAY